MKHIPFALPYNEFDFKYMRSNGPGGQNVNKTNSAVQLRWNLKMSQSIPFDLHERLLQKLSGRLTIEGELLIRSETSRDQEANKKECLRKLIEILEKALFVPKKRLKTKPTRSSKERRLKSKNVRGEIKKLRSKID